MMIWDEYMELSVLVTFHAILQGVWMKGIKNKIIISQKPCIIHIYGLHHYKGKLSKFFSDYICMYVCMYKGWAFTALAPRPTVVYCA
jgi:hypothetical protein